MFVCGGVLVRVYTVSPNQPIRWQPANMALPVLLPKTMTQSRSFALVLRAFAHTFLVPFHFRQILESRDVFDIGGVVMFGHRNV